MCVHVNSLPEDCLLPIFDRIPLYDLLHIDQVCHQWASLKPSACARRHTLTLIVGLLPGDTLRSATGFSIPFNSTSTLSYHHGVYFGLPIEELDASLRLPFLQSTKSYYKSSHDIQDSLHDGPEEYFTEMGRLHHARFERKLVPYLTSLLPNVSTLVVIHKHCFEDELNQLVVAGPVASQTSSSAPSWSLKILKLWIQTYKYGTENVYKSPPDQNPIAHLLQRIKQQSSLKALTLNIIGTPPGIEAPTYDHTFPVELFAFIGQLSVLQLDLVPYDPANTIWDAVHRFQSTRLRQIGLGTYRELDDLMTQPTVANVLNPQFVNFTSRVTRLYRQMGMWSFESVQQLEDFCGRFGSLTGLQLNWLPKISFTKLVSTLSTLRQLTYLVLTIEFGKHPVNPFALVDRVECGEAVPPSLPQVKTLRLNIRRPSHNAFESLSPLVFPSVEVIIWQHFGCGDRSFQCSVCTSNVRVYEGYECKRGEQCHRLLMQSLRARFGRALTRLYDANKDWIKIWATERATAAAASASAAAAAADQEK